MRWGNHKATFHRLLAWLRVVKTWQLVVMLLLGIIVSATLLRMNSLGMVERRTAVLKADASGDRDATRKAVVELQKYVTTHMNAGMGDGFYLSKTYEHDRDAAIQAATGASNPSSAAYQQASVECREKWQGGRESFRNDYVQCVIDRVGALTPAADPTSGLNLPKADSYKINYSSPWWSPDLAGLTVLFCVLVLFVIVGRLLMLIVLRALVRRHYRSA